uniref:Sushi, von Willebrand factor type A, EGF and pentraxin domain-containing protein 1 n=1 Tax=Anopheles melas TaxID=34690 RepID=A0A182TF42_9DIPT
MLRCQQRRCPGQMVLLLLSCILLSCTYADEEENFTSASLVAGTGPVATSKGCPFPGVPAHGSVIFSDDSLANNTVATYYCERGFELLGPSRRACIDSQWIPEGIPFCVLNVAAGKAPMQISTEASGIPQKAIDGSTSAFFSPDTCSLTKPERVPWWYVNLLEPYMVQLVRLDFGKSCCGKGKPATIVVRVGNNRPDLGTNPICNRFTGSLEEGQPLFLPCNPPMPGAFVSVHLETNAPSQLSICEAFVYTDQALPIERCPAFRDQPPGASASYNGKCYIFYSRQPATLRDALAFCRARGGTLINESNPALQGFISWELWRRHRSDTSSQYWMGAVRDAQDRNTWKWIGGEEVSVSFWNLPGGDEDCARYDGSKGWLWSDTNCNTQLNFICQHQPKACGRPEQPPNSTMIAPKGFDVGAVVEYSCDEGHLLVGPKQRTCLETGFYNEFPPVCKYIECGLPASIPHGYYDLVNGTVGYLSTVMYRCAEGYEMVGRAVLICDIDERWNGPPPRCELIECDPLPTLFPNGVIVSTNQTVYGTRAEVHCNRGFVPDGEPEIVCTASGQWSHPLPKCVPDQSAGPVTVRPSAASTTAASSRAPPVLIVSPTTPALIGGIPSRTRQPTGGRRPGSTVRYPTQAPPASSTVSAAESTTASIVINMAGPTTAQPSRTTSTTESPLFSIEIDDGTDDDYLPHGGPNRKHTNRDENDEDADDDYYYRNKPTLHGGYRPDAGTDYDDDNDDDDHHANEPTFDDNFDSLEGFFIGTNEDYSLPPPPPPPPSEVRPGSMGEEAGRPYRPQQPSVVILSKEPGSSSSSSSSSSSASKPASPKPAVYEPSSPPAVVSVTPQVQTHRPQVTGTTGRRPSTTTTTRGRHPAHEQDILLSHHPQDNEIPGSVNIRQDQSPKVNVPFAVNNVDDLVPADGSSGSNGGTDGLITSFGGAGGSSGAGGLGGAGGSAAGDRKESKNAKLNLGAIVALGAFGGFVFLAAVITTIVIVVRRNRTSNQHYRHRASPDCNTVASFSSSSSESRNGLNRYYRQAWENLHESASKSHNNHSGLKRKETMDAPVNRSRSRENLDVSRPRDLDRSRENLSSARSRDYGRDSMALRDGSEMVVSDVCVKGEKKRHHHHHHKSSHRNDFREPNILGSGNGRREHRHY